MPSARPIPRIISALLLCLVAVALSATLNAYTGNDLSVLNGRHLLSALATGVLLILSLSSLAFFRRQLPKKGCNMLLSGSVPDDSLFRLFAAKSNDMMHINDHTGTILYVNPATTALLGYREDEMIHAPAASFIVPEDRETIRQDMEAVMRGIDLPPREIRLLRNDGSLLDVEVKGFALKGKGNKPCLGAVLRDVSSRKKNEQMTRRQKDWEQTFNTITDFVSVHDSSFRIIQANRALCEFLEKPPQDIIGKFCYQLFHNTDHAIEGCPHVKAVHAGHPVSAEIHDPHIGFPLQITCSPFFDDQGHFKGSVHVARTIGDSSRPATGKRSLIAICASCKEIRAGKDNWLKPEEYIHLCYGNQFTHSICPACQQKLYPQFSEN